MLLAGCSFWSAEWLAVAPPFVDATGRSSTRCIPRDTPALGPPSHPPAAGCDCEDGPPSLRLLPTGSDDYYKRPCDTVPDMGGTLRKCETFSLTGRRQISTECGGLTDCFAEIEINGAKSWVVDHECQREIGLFEYICDTQSTPLSTPDNPTCAAGELWVDFAARLDVSVIDH